MTENQGRTPAEVAANEEGIFAFYEFLTYAVGILLMLASAYGGWQVGLWLLA